LFVIVENIWVFQLEDMITTVKPTIPMEGWKKNHIARLKRSTNMMHHIHVL